MKMYYKTNRSVLEFKTNVSALVQLGNDVRSVIFQHLNPGELIILSAVSQSIKQEAYKPIYWQLFLIYQQISDPRMVFTYHPEFRTQEYQHLGKNWSSLFDKNMNRRIQSNIKVLEIKVQEAKSPAEQFDLADEIKTLSSFRVKKLITMNVITPAYIASLNPTQRYNLRESEAVLVIIKNLEKAGKSTKSELNNLEKISREKIAEIVNTPPPVPPVWDASFMLPLI